MIKFVCIIGDYHTWREEKGYEGERNRRRVGLRLSGVDIADFLDSGVGLWKFLFGKTFDACKKVQNNRGRLEKALVCVRVDDDSLESKHRTLYYIQEKEGNLTYVIPQPHPVTARDKAVTVYNEPLILTASHIRKTSSRIIAYIKDKEMART